MSKAQMSYNQEEKLRSYSSVFSRMTLCPIVESDDYSLLNMKIKRDKDKIGKKFNTYLEYIKFAYSELSKKYRCQYVYKTVLINMLLKKYGTENSLIINEFRVGGSVADMVLFNGTSKAFEIKTELDSDKRLNSQLSDYSKIFKESYIVIPESMLDKYKVDETVGIITLSIVKKKLILTEIRSSIENMAIDVDFLMRSIRTSEYKNIVQAYYGILPNMGNCVMFEVCKAMMKQIPSDKLHRLFLDEIKKRKSNNSFLNSYHNELKQFCLSMNMDKEQYDIFDKQLCNPINLENVLSVS
jgi:hypothetical protein